MSSDLLTAALWEAPWKPEIGDGPIQELAVAHYAAVGHLIEEQFGGTPLCFANFPAGLARGRHFHRFDDPEHFVPLSRDRIRNTSERDGTEIAQIYVGLRAEAQEPPKRLVAWRREPISAGASRMIMVNLDPRLMSIWNSTQRRWELLPGYYRVYVGGILTRYPPSATDPIMNERQRVEGAL